MEKYGTEIETSIYSKHLNLEWNCTVYLPYGYDEQPERRYPVVYMLHGAFGNPRQMIDRCGGPATMEKLAAEGKAEQSILVFVDGMNSYYMDGMLLKMESAIMEELIPWVNANFRVKAGRENCATCGLSMGGHGAGKLALKYPEVFSAAVMMSPAVDDEPEIDGTIRGRWYVFTDGTSNFCLENWVNNHPCAFANVPEEKGLPVRLYCISGTADEAVGIEMVESFSKKFDGSKFVNAEFCAIPGYGHEFPFWTISIGKGFEWLYKL